MTMVIRLLKSWATPPASWPIELHLLRLNQGGLRVLADARLLRQRGGALPQFPDESAGD